MFLDAGNHASQSCTCGISYVLQQLPLPFGCYAGPATFESRSTLACFSASCDWDPYNEACVSIKQQLGTCPLFDAITHESLRSVEGLRYVKEAVGFTTPYFSEPGVPFGYPQGSAGRCLNARCRTDTPPMTGVTTLEPGESWCDTFASWKGRVLHSPFGDLCCPGTDYDTIVGTYSCAQQCIDLGQAWGVCSDSNKPKLPSAGFDYDLKVLEKIRLMTLPALLEAHPGCGTLPLTVRSNHASRHGGGLFQDGCDTGLEQKKLCWVGGIAQKTAASTLSFEGNSADGAGGAIYTRLQALLARTDSNIFYMYIPRLFALTGSNIYLYVYIYNIYNSCYSLGMCKDALNLAIGLPHRTGGTALTFLSNQAGGYGEDIATAPSELVLSDRTDRHFVPGKTQLSMAFSILDTQGQTIKGTDNVPISHQVFLL